MVLLRHPKEFDPNAQRYTCCFGLLWHRRICAWIIGVLELFILTVYFCTTITMYAVQQGTSLQSTEEDHAMVPPTLDKTVLFDNRTFIGCWLQKSVTSLSVCVVVFALGVPIVLLMMYGVWRIRPAYLLPHLFSQLVAALALAGVMIFSLFLTKTAFEYSAKLSSTAAVNRTRADVEPGGEEAKREEQKDEDNVNVYDAKNASIYCLMVNVLLILAFPLTLYFMYHIWRCYLYLKDRLTYHRWLKSNSVKLPYHMQMGAYLQQQPLLTLRD